MEIQDARITCLLHKFAVLMPGDSCCGAVRSSFVGHFNVQFCFEVRQSLSALQPLEKEVQRT